MEFFHKATRFPFMHTRRMWFGISAVVLVASLLLLATRGLNLGIDFTGGVALQFAYPEVVNIEQARTALNAAGYSATVTNFGSDHEVMVRLLPRDNLDVNELSREVMAILQTASPGVQLRGSEVVGPQIGDELTNQGGLAVLVTFLAVAVYIMIKFQWKMAIGAVVAALHDPIIILGVFSLFRDWLTFDLSVLAAILAVIGYSLNDTVVVFDRVRENFQRMRRAAAEEILDASVNETLSRTIITSGATLLVVVVLLIFGGEALRGFSWALTVGVIVGTYSSIYIAAATSLQLNISALDLFPPRDDKDEIDAMP